jgi:hypothetical protein
VPYLVWSVGPVKEIEELKMFRQARGGEAIVDEPAKVAEVLAFLKKHRAEHSANGSQTEVHTSEDVLVHEIGGRP